MRTRITATVAAAASLAALASCGGDDEKGRRLPAEARQELQKQLTSIENRFEAGGGACADITENQASIQSTLEGLPRDVDADVRNALNDGFARLFELTSEQCDAEKGQETETEAAPEPPPVTTTDEAPPPVETQPETQPEEESGGEGKGKGKGNGNSGGNDGAGTGGGLQVPGGGSGGATPGDG